MLREVIDGSLRHSYNRVVVLVLVLVLVLTPVPVLVLVLVLVLAVLVLVLAPVEQSGVNVESTVKSNSNLTET